jgi:hypothetical protein
MPNVLQSAATWLAGMFKEHASQTVTYKRGLAAVSLSATLGRTEYSQTDDRGFVTQFRSHDWVITAADLTLGEPAKGDRIIATVNGESKTFEVLDLSGVNHFDWTDPFKVGMRIHTKEIG